MKQRIPALLLAMALLLTCLPMGALAEELTGGYFYFSAENGEQVAAAPQRIEYSGGQTIRQALDGSDAVTLTTDPGNGFVTAVNGVTGNYAYGSDTDAALDGPASGVGYFRFCGDSDHAAPSESLMQLMQVMADYTLEEVDVRAAAKDAYDEALAAYPGASDEAAARHTAAITEAIEAYRRSQDTAFSVTFSGYAGGDVQITAENAYGRVFIDEGHNGTLSLPAGDYTFCVRKGSLLVSGEIKVSGSRMVEVTLPEGGWFDEEAFGLSGGYGEEFEDGRYLCTVEEGTVTAVVPDSFVGKLYPYVALTAQAEGATVTAHYTDADGRQREKAVPVKSQVTSVENTLKTGAKGSTVIFRASRTGEDGYVQSEELTLRLDRMPTLSALRVTNSSNQAQAADVAFSHTRLEYSYRIVETDTLKLRPTATDSSYTVLVNGQPLDSEGWAEVAVDGECEIVVTVSGGGYTTTYILKILPGAGKRVTFTMDADTTLVVVNKNDEELECTRKREGSKIQYLYTLVPGEEYSYVATRNQYYHAKKCFTLLDTAASSSNFEVSVEAGDWLTGLALGSAKKSGSQGSLALSGEFASDLHTYTATVPDASNTVWLWCSVEKGSPEALYRSQSTSNAGEDRAVSITPGNSNSSSTGVQLKQVLLTGSAYENTVTLRVSYDDSTAGVTYYTDYEVTLARSLSLRDMTVSSQGGTVLLNRESSQDTGYHRSETAYSVLVPAAASSLELTLQTHDDSPRYGDTDNGYQVAVNGRPVTGEMASVALSGDSETETITVTLTNRYNSGAQTTYTITVRKAATTAVTFDLEPGDGLVYLYETGSGNRVWPGTDGSFALSEGFTYHCTFSRKDYVALSGDLWLSGESGTIRLIFGTETFDTPERVPITLTPAPENTALDPTIPAEWPNFRGTDTNNGVINAKTPIAAEEGTLYWATKLGDGYASNALGCPILVDDCLIVYSGNKLYRIDKRTGETLATGIMAEKSSFSITPPTYCEGVILVGLSGGGVQAFNAKTLESLWLYTDPLGGQPNCPITVHNGYVYTGFWKREDGDAAFVCLSLTDEDPTNTTEAKTATWRHVQTGGFYWAGAYVCDDFVLVGTDDGRQDSLSQTGSLLLLEPLTGAVLDSRSDLNGDVRSEVSYDAATGAFYFTSKGGSFYQVRTEQGAEGWCISECRELRLENGTDDPKKPPMSTCTPVVYNGRAYIGVSGSSQFGQYSGHNITVIDLESWGIAYTVPTQGYPQTSGLLTTAYEGDNGYVYVYFFDNYTPGILRVLRDKPGQTRADYVTKETFQGTGYQMAYALFTPVGEQAQHAICSPIADSEGTIYFKNDSAQLMAFGSAIEKLEVTTPPAKTTYQQGAEFSAEGMVVTATLANGLTRDVTGQVIVTGFDTTSAGACQLTVTLPQVRYHNQPDSDGGMAAGVSSLQPYTTFSVEVEAARTAETMQELTVSDDSVRVSFDGVTQAGWRIAVASYDAEGRMLGLTLQEATGQITEVLPLPAAAKAAEVRVFVLDGNNLPQMAHRSASIGR